MKKAVRKGTEETDTEWTLGRAEQRTRRSLRHSPTGSPCRENSDHRHRLYSKMLWLRIFLPSLIPEME